MRAEHQTERFPQSAVLFKFCLSVLQKRLGTQKAHDQDVGDILRFNASDTSHWKRGKKPVRSVHALEALARKLDADYETLRDLSDGTLSFEEAWFEFCEAENLKELRAKLSPEMRRVMVERMAVLESVATGILSNAEVFSIPVFVPEVASSLPFLEIVARDVGDRLASSVRVKTGFYSIRYRKGDMRAHTRLAIMREIARIVLHSERQQFGLPARLDELLPFEVAHLSSALLVPMNLLKGEFQKVSVRSDISAGLADTFWVPKGVIRSRMAYALTSSMDLDVVSSEAFVVSPRPQPSGLEVFDLSDDDLEEGSRVPSAAPALASLN
jgi:hypothetical protein